MPMMPSENPGACSSTTRSTFFAKSSRARRPVAFAQRVGRMAAEKMHHVLARRADRVVDEARRHDGDERIARPVAVLGVVVGALEIFDRRADVRVGRIGEAACRRIERRVRRQALAGDVDLEGGGIGPIALDVADELGRQRGARQELEERELGARRCWRRPAPRCACRRRASRRSPCRRRCRCAITSALVRISSPLVRP